MQKTIDQEHLFALITAQQEIASADVDLDGLLALTVERAQKMTGAVGAAIEWIRGGELICRAACGIASGRLGSISPLEGSLSGECVRAGQTLYSDALEKYEPINGEASSQVRSIMAAPLKCAHTTMGVLEVMSLDASAFDQQTIQTFHVLAQLLGTVMGSALKLEVVKALASQGALALEDSERRFESAFHSSDVGMAMVGLDGRYLRVNPALCRLLGYEKEELLAKQFQSITHSEDLSSSLAYLQRVASGEIIYCQAEKRWIHKQGQIVWGLLNVAPVIGAQGYPLYLVTQVQDITERKQAEAELQALNAELDQRVRERTAEIESSRSDLESFAYAVAHDLMTPLRGVNGFSHVLMEDYADRLDEPGVGYLRRLCAATRHMEELIQDLLVLGRVTGADLRREPVDLTSLAKIIAEDIQDSSDRNVDFIIQDGLTVEGDERLLRVALSNLFSNAWKFTRARPTAKIELGQMLQEDRRIFFVRDNGAGFDMTYSSKLFEAFQRLHSTAEYEGTGIGLATVKRIIRRHGGQLWAYGVVNEGATFYFTIEH